MCDWQPNWEKKGVTFFKQNKTKKSLFMSKHDMKKAGTRNGKKCHPKFVLGQRQGVESWNKCRLGSYKEIKCGDENQEQARDN